MVCPQSAGKPQPHCPKPCRGACILPSSWNSTPTPSQTPYLPASLTFPSILPSCADSSPLGLSFSQPLLTLPSAPVHCELPKVMLLVILSLPEAW